MKILFVQLALAGALVTSGSGAPVTQFDQPAVIKAAQPVAAVVTRPRATRIVYADYQLSEQERSVLAFLRLKADAERNAH